MDKGTAGSTPGQLVEGTDWVQVAEIFCRITGPAVTMKDLVLCDCKRHRMGLQACWCAPCDNHQSCVPTL